MDWFRWHHGSVTDPKFQVIARKSGASLPDVLAVWAYILEQASSNPDRGCFGCVDAEALDVLFNFPSTETRTQDILKSMEMRGLVADGRIVQWEKRQPKREREDDSGERVRAYRERVRKGGGTVGGYLKHHAFLMERDGGKCVYCGTTENLCIDHMVPVVLGGDDQPDNLAIACKACNSGKSGRTPEGANYEILTDAAKRAYVTACARLSRPVTPRGEEKRVDEKDGERRATRIPPNFEPLPEPEAERGIDRATELANFRDYWTAKSGKDAAKLDWQATWRTWARKAHRKPADVARMTVPSTPGEDPALKKIKEDATKASKPSPEILARMDALKGKVYQ